MAGAACGNSTGWTRYAGFAPEKSSRCGDGSGRGDEVVIANFTLRLHSPPMTISISYSSRRNEVWRWYWQAWRRELWKTHLLVFAVVFWAAAVAIYGGLPNRPAPFATVTMIAIVPLISFVLFPILKFKPQQRTLIVDEDGIETSIGSIRATVPWQEVAEVREDGDYLVIQRTNRNAFIIPPRAFDDANSRATFCDFVRSKAAANVRSPHLPADRN